jgi:hypothetical protein
MRARLPAAFAAVGETGALDGVEYWKASAESYKAHGNSMSEAILDGLTVICPLLAGKLFSASAARCIIVTSEVVDMATDEGLERAFAHGLAKGRELPTSSPLRTGSA